MTFEQFKRAQEKIAVLSRNLLYKSSAPDKLSDENVEKLEMYNEYASMPVKKLESYYNDIAKLPNAEDRFNFLTTKRLEALRKIQNVKVKSTIKPKANKLLTKKEYIEKQNTIEELSQRLLSTYKNEVEKFGYAPVVRAFLKKASRSEEELGKEYVSLTGKGKIQDAKIEVITFNKIKILQAIENFIKAGKEPKELKTSKTIKEIKDDLSSFLYRVNRKEKVNKSDKQINKEEAIKEREKTISDIAREKLKEKERYLIQSKRKTDSNQEKRRKESEKKKKASKDEDPDYIKEILKNLHANQSYIKRRTK